ncbi:hypothetical protein LJC17_03335 [Acholeplasma sp. OttesenSCG-928-E16]|nr:hypothetical protein [Acholeplasma sp. OttesenSCG-928-E16]
MKKVFLILFASLISISFFACDNTNKEPVEITIWSYYNSTDAKTFKDFVDTFNAGEGKKLGIKANHVPFNKTTDLQVELTKSANKEVGALDFPDMFQTYGDFLTTLDKQFDISVPLDDYFSDADLSKYVEGFLNDGRIYADNSLRIIPFAKSTEVLMLNKTMWDSFNSKLVSASKTAYTYDDLQTIEKILEISNEYYLLNEGKSFFARDSIANEFYNAIKSLGDEVFTLKSDGSATFHEDKAKDVLRVMYDNFFVPYMEGHYEGKAKTEDFSSGHFASFVGSISGVKYLPSELDMVFLPAPTFLGKDKYTIQQGAGYAVAKNEDESVIKACVSFLKYSASNADNNATISSSMGYIPSLKDAIDFELIKEKYTTSQLSIFKEKDPNATLADVLASNSVKNQLATFDTILTNVVSSSSDYILHSQKPFNGLSYIRNIFECSIWGTPSNDIKTLMADFKNADYYLDNSTEEYSFDSWSEAVIAKIKAALSM